MKLSDINDAVLIWGAVTTEQVNLLKQEGKLVVVPEHRPFMLGLKYNCPRLRRAEVNFVYCTDNSLGILFYKEKIKKTKLFYKEKKEEGIVAASGSLYVALLSKLHNVPVEPVPAPGNLDSLYEGDASTLGGKDFILVKDKQEYLVMPEDDLIEPEVLT